MVRRGSLHAVLFSQTRVPNGWELRGTVLHHKLCSLWFRTATEGFADAHGIVKLLLARWVARLPTLQVDRVSTTSVLCSVVDSSCTTTTLVNTSIAESNTSLENRPYRPHAHTHTTIIIIIIIIIIQFLPHCCRRHNNRAWFVYNNASGHAKQIDSNKHHTATRVATSGR